MPPSTGGIFASRKRNVEGSLASVGTLEPSSAVPQRLPGLSSFTALS